MYQTEVQKPRALVFQTPILVLSFVSLACAVIQFILSCVYGPVTRVLFYLFYLIIDIAPAVLLILYVLKFLRACKATVLVPIVFALTGASELFRYGFNTYSDIAICFIFTVAFVLATISASKGLSNKIFVLIPTVLALAVHSFEFAATLYRGIVYIGYADLEFLFWYFSNEVGLIAPITLNAALLLFGLKNRIPAIFPASSQKSNHDTQLSEERALRLLADKLELGMITSEEYQAARAEIIKNL